MSQMEFPKNNNERVIGKGKMIELVENTIISGGKEHTFERARRAPGVRLIIQTPDGGFLLNREKRHELGLEEDLRLPGGKVFDRLEDFKAFTANGGDMKMKAREAAIKEAVEEAGINPTEIDFVGISKNGATMEWDLYYFVVTKYDEVEKSLQDTEAGEIMGSSKLTRAEFQAKALSGEISEDRSVAMILRYLNK